MTTAGLYETSGDWLYDVGLPGQERHRRRDRHRRAGQGRRSGRSPRCSTRPATASGASSPRRSSRGRSASTCSPRCRASGTVGGCGASSPSGRRTPRTAPPSCSLAAFACVACAPAARGRPRRREGARREVRAGRPARRAARRVRARRAVRADRRGPALRRPRRSRSAGRGTRRPGQGRPGRDRPRRPLRVPPRLPGRRARPGLRLRGVVEAPHARATRRPSTPTSRSERGPPRQARAPVLALLRLQRLQQHARGRLGDDPARLRRRRRRGGARREARSRSATAPHEGAERAAWGDEKLELVDGTHPVVYPAAGLAREQVHAGALPRQLGRGGRRLRRHARAAPRAASRRS